MKFTIERKVPILISANHAISGEIFREFPKFPRSEIFYPTLEGGYPVEEKCSIPLDQQDTQPLEQVSDGLLLLLSCAPGLSPGYLLELLHRLLVPPSQSFNWEGDEGDALPLTSL